MKCYLLACLLCASMVGFAQNNLSPVDSLKSLINTLPKSPERVDEMVLAGLLLRKNNMDSAALFANLALEESRQLQYRKGEAAAFNLLGILAYYTSNLDSSEIYQQQSIAIRSDIGDTLGLGKAYVDLGNTLADRGNLKKAIEHYLTAQTYFVAIKDSKQLATVLVNIGSIYHEQEDYAKTLEYYFKALEYKDKMAPNGLATVYNNISLVYKEQGKYTEALDYSFKSLELKKSLNYERGIATSYGTIGSIYFKMGQADEAGSFYDMAIELQRTIKDKYGLGTSLGGRGNVWMLKGQYKEAEQYYLEALPLAEEEGILPLMRDVRLALSDLYAAQGNHKAAFEMRKLYEAAQDSLLNTETYERIAELMMEFETVQKEQELLLKEAEIKRQQEVNKLQAVGFGCIVGFLLIAGALYFSRSRIKQKAELQEMLAKEQKIRFKAVIDAQEQERKRIAQDLHDGLGQLLSTARLNVGALEDSLEATDEESEKIWQNALGLIDDAVQEVRNVSHNMMPSALIVLGLVAALREQIAKINQAGKIAVKLETSGMEERLEEAVEITLYRVVQEVLNNAIKHSRANEIVVRIAKTDGSLSVSIHDNGQGLDLQLIKQSRGIGWKNIYSRVELINGVIDMNSTPGAGTNIKVLVPAA